MIVNRVTKQRTKDLVAAADAIGLDMRVIDYGEGEGFPRYEAFLEGVYLMQHGTLSIPKGRGDTEDAAALDYCNKISWGTVVINPDRVDGTRRVIDTVEVTMPPGGLP